jgi:hypothetical protein
MKRWLIPLIAFIFVLSYSTVYAQNDSPLGKGHLGIKVDYIGFSDSELDEFDVDNGIYVGLEGYIKVKNAPNLYLGGEVGFAEPDDSLTDNSLGFPIKVDYEFKYVPIEINAKWIFDMGSDITLALGAGLSENYVDIDAKASALGLSISDSDDDWIFGGQFLLDINYSSGNLFYGIDAKHKITQEFKDDGTKFTHYSVGAHVGWMF